MLPLWRPIIMGFELSAKPECIWTKVLDYVGPSRKLRFKATGTWTWQKPPVAPNPVLANEDTETPTKALSPTAEDPDTKEQTAAPSGDNKDGNKPTSPSPSAEVGTCGPDGDIYASPSTDALFPEALLGTLIGKIGGSSAVVKNSGAFIVGSYCVLEVGDTKGPLFLTINDTYSGMADNSGTIHLSIWEAT